MDCVGRLGHGGAQQPFARGLGTASWSDNSSRYIECGAPAPLIVS
jgi:hypothetical protein